MPDMQIHRITVTDSKGVDHTWEGIDGWLSVRSITKKGQVYQQALDAHLSLEPDPSIKIQPGEM